jgi:putative alpha-1,2-mannosidase
MVPFNLRGLFDSMGGADTAIKRLDRHFTELNAGPGSEFAFMGNEPELKTPWVYAFAGTPWRAQETVRRILLQLFTNSPGGMPGNDDGGTISSWVVFASIGLYPQIPGVGGFVVGSPLFPRVTMQLANGSEIRISAPQAAADHPYVQNLTLNGADDRSPWIAWNDVENGAELHFTPGDMPNRRWGSSQESPTPSYDAR